MVGPETKVTTAAVVMVDVHNSSARRQRGGEDEVGMITEATTRRSPCGGREKVWRWRRG